MTVFVVVVAVALLGFAAWTAMLVRSVDELRGRVEVRVGWLQQLTRLEVDAQDAQELGLAGALDALAREIVEDHDTGIDLRARARAAVGAANPNEAIASLVPAIRRETSAISAELGQHWGAIYRLAAMALLLAMSTLGLLIYIRMVVLRRARARLSMLEAHLARADRLAAIGTMAAGIAHEINNPLTYVMSNLELLAEDEEDDAERKSLIAGAKEGTERVRRIVQNLCEVARPRKAEVQRCDLVSILDGALQIAGAELGDLTRVERAYEPVPQVYAAKDQLGQVCLNLILNAASAMRQQPNRDHQLTLRVFSGEGDVVVCEVQDTGGGVDPDVVDRLFEPFVTTKPIGKGTGLGLFVSRNLVVSMGGEIELRRVEGGTSARVTLRAVAHVSSEEQAVVARPAVRIGR